MYKKAFQTFITPILILIIVLISIILILYTIRSNTEKEQVDNKFDGYEQMSLFARSFLSTPKCLNLGEFGAISWQIPIQAVLNTTSLDRLNNFNHDLSCIDNIEFLYGLKVYNINTNEEWNIGLDEQPDWAEISLKTQFHVALQYGLPTDIQPGEAILTGYFGEIPRFYTTIKKSCLIRKSQEVTVNTLHKIIYNGKNFCVDDYCFEASFTCMVDNFIVEKGESLLYLDYDQTTSSIQVRK